MSVKVNPQEEKEEEINSQDNKINEKEKDAENESETEPKLNDPDKVNKSIEENENKNGVPKMFEDVNGKNMLSNDWIDYMFSHHPKTFPGWYNKLASKQQKERYYLSRHVPNISVIMNDTLYDTEKAEMFFTEEKDIRDGKMKVYYYRSPSGFFFKILCIMGRSDELITIEKKDVKKLLGKHPDIYRKIIEDEVME